MNIGGFLRRLSTSSDQDNEEERPGASILDSMAAKKNGIMSDISSTFHQIKRRASLSINELGGSEEEVVGNSPPPPPPQPTSPQSSTHGQPTSPPPAKSPPRKSPPPVPPPPQHPSERRRSSASKPRPPRPPSPPKDRRPSQSSISDPPFRDRRNSLVNDPPTVEPYRRESISEDFGFEAGNDEAGTKTITNGNSEKVVSGDMSTLSDITQYECQKIVSALGDLMSFDNDGNSSSASEYGGDHGDAPLYAEEAPIERRASLASVESLSDEMALSVRQFVSKFTEMTFHNSNEISQKDKANFGKYCQHHTARSWFAKQLQKMRQTQQRVDETTFFSLVQHFSVVLFECNEAEDYVPAMHLMHMSFTFYTDVKSLESSSPKMYLYSFLKDQAIWLSLRFWNAAFFEAVQEQRANNPICWNQDGETAVENDTRYQENIMFGQLSAFSCNMRALGLNKDVCLEFLRKQSTIAGLKSDRISMLRENIEKWNE